MIEKINEIINNVNDKLFYLDFKKWGLTSVYHDTIKRK